MWTAVWLCNIKRRWIVSNGKLLFFDKINFSFDVLILSLLNEIKMAEKSETIGGIFFAYTPVNFVIFL